VQAGGQPRAVAITAAPGEHLRARDHDPRAWALRAHAHVGTRVGASEVTPVLPIE
jgi:hypothetical protein